MLDGGAVISQCLNAVAQCRDGLVDDHGLFELLLGDGPRVVLHALATRQIHQRQHAPAHCVSFLINGAVQLAVLHVAVCCQGVGELVGLLEVQMQLQHRVRATALYVLRGALRPPALQAVFQKVVRCLSVLHVHQLQIFNVRAAFVVLSDLKRCKPFVVSQQVVNMLDVYLIKRHVDFPHQVTFFLINNSGEDIIHCHLSNSRLFTGAEHGIRLSRSCLTIHHSSTIETVHNILDNFSHGQVVHNGLIYSWCKSVIDIEKVGCVEISAQFYALAVWFQMHTNVR